MEIDIQNIRKKSIQNWWTLSEIISYSLAQLSIAEVLYSYFSIQSSCLKLSKWPICCPCTYLLIVGLGLISNDSLPSPYLLPFLSVDQIITYGNQVSFRYSELLM